MLFFSKNLIFSHLANQLVKSRLKRHKQISPRNWFHNYFMCDLVSHCGTIQDSEPLGKTAGVGRYWFSFTLIMLFVTNICPATQRKFIFRK